MGKIVPTAEMSGSASFETLHALTAAESLWPEGVTPSWTRFDSMRVRAVNENELTSIKALIAYVAHMRGLHEVRIERQFSDQFSIPNATCLPSERYDDAIRYLVDQVPA